MENSDNRAVSYLYDNYNNKTVFNLYPNVHWFKNDSGLWFVEYSKEGKVYKTVRFKDYQVKPLFDHKKLSKAFRDTFNQNIKPSEFSITALL